MNNKLFNTTPDTATLQAEYNKYIDNAAHDLLTRFPAEAHWESVKLENAAQEDARWGSWVVSARNRAFAFHQACFAVNPSHTLGAVRPTIEAAAIAVGRHILLRYQEITKKVRPAYYRLAWVKKAVLSTSDFLDFLSVGDLNPLVESDAHFQTDHPAVAKNTALVYYRSYTSMGIDPPPLKLVGSNEDGMTIEEIPLVNHELEAEQRVFTKVDVRSESP